MGCRDISPATVECRRLPLRSSHAGEMPRGHVGGDGPGAPEPALSLQLSVWKLFKPRYTGMIDYITICGD